MRPLLHFTAEQGWINDPHGLTFHAGEYHLFHQFVPDSLVWGPNCHWGHAVSPDLLTWSHREIAIAPGDGDDGIWTGSLVDDRERTRILYTSVAHPDLGLGRVRLATPHDTTWDTWTKGEIVVRPPAELDLIAFRDPFVRREGEGWRMFVGAATRGGDALALTYTSEDLDTWTYDGVALSRSTTEVEPVWMGALWECPQIFDVDGHWAMVSSVWDDDVLHYAGYALGGPETYAAGRFSPTEWGQLSFGGSYYAPSFFRDKDGRPCLMFWMRGVVDAEAGWASCLSVPHLLSVREGRLVASPHPDLDLRRQKPLEAGELAASFDLTWHPTSTDAELLLEGPAGKTARLAVQDQIVTLERPGQEAWSMPWSGERLRVVVDGSVIEVSSDRGILGGPVEHTTTWRSASEGVEAWFLGTGR
ncbi:glycoside hydrolase family 32 protein [Nocardioides sp. AN3]